MAAGRNVYRRLTTRDGTSAEFGTSGERRGFTGFARVGVI